MSYVLAAVLVLGIYVLAKMGLWLADRFLDWLEDPGRRR